MSDIFEFFARHIILAVVIEVTAVVFIVWAVAHNNELVGFEDEVIRLIRHKLRRWKFRMKVRAVNKARDVFLFFYLPLRRIKRRILKRLLHEFGLRAVKSMEQVDYEILSRR